MNSSDLSSIEWTVLAVDPGKTCGYVASVVDAFGMLVQRPRIVGENDVEYVLRLAHHLLVGDKKLTVVAEAFRIIPGKAKSLSGSRVYAAEALGAIRKWCGERGVMLIEQPSTIVKTVGRPLLEMAGLWEQTKGYAHARDAARHFVAYCLTLQRGENKCSTSSQHS